MDPTATLTTLQLNPGTVVAERYEVIEKVGSGGVGLVFKVIDRELNDQVVALKLLHPHLAREESLFKRFRNELLVARALSHPNIVRLHDIGKAEGGFSYITMEYVDGYSLKDRLGRSRGEAQPADVPGDPMSFEESVSIFYEILGAVSYAHGKHIIHRDLKPANVLMSRAGEVKLADFGTARITGMDTSLTQTGQLIGTPDYMSPEQIRAEQLDTACDIYALGIIGYELVVGHRPFVADTAVAMAFKHLSEPIPPFATPDGSIPKWFEEAVQKAGAKDKAQRFASVGEFAQVLAQHIPSLAKSSGFYPSQSYHTAGGVDRATTGTATMPSTSPPPQTSRRDGRFEIGSTQDRESSDRWEIGSLEERANRPDQSSTGGRQGETRSRMFPMLLVVALVIGIGGGAYLFLKKKDRLEVAGTTPPITENIVESNTVPASEIGGAGTVSTPPATVSTEPGNNSQPPTDAIAPDAKVEPGVIGPALDPQDSVEVKSEAKASPSAQEAEISPVVKPEPEKAEPEVVPPPPEALAIAFKVQGRRGEEIGKSLSEDELGNVNWVASVTGLTGLGTDDESKQRIKVLGGTIALRASDVQKKVKAVTLRSRPLDKAIPEGGSPVRFGGSLSELAKREEFSDGTFRLELLRDGKTVGSKEITVVPLPKEAETPQTVEAGAGARIDIAKLENSNQQTPSNSLPPANQPLGSVVAPLVGSETVDAGALLPPPIAPAVVENYSGKLGSSEGSSEAPRKLTLRLQVSDDNTISGSAEVEGFGAFVIQGTVFPRGVKLTLSNPEFSITLSGSREKGRGMRGVFIIPSMSKRGSWEANAAP